MTAKKQATKKKTTRKAAATSKRVPAIVGKIKRHFGEFVARAGSLSNADQAYKAVRDKIKPLVRGKSQDELREIFDAHLRKIAEDKYKAQPNARDKMKGNGAARWKVLTNTCCSRFVAMGQRGTTTKAFSFKDTLKAAKQAMNKETQESIIAETDAMLSHNAMISSAKQLQCLVIVIDAIVNRKPE